MIIALIVKCDECGAHTHLRLEEMSHTIVGDRLDILDRYVCDRCIQRQSMARQELLA